MISKVFFALAARATARLPSRFRAVNLPTGHRKIGASQVTPKICTDWSTLLTPSNRRILI